MREVLIQRPITVPKLAKTVFMKPHQVMALLIVRGIFPSPSDPVDDGIASEIAASVDFKLIIDESEQE